MGLTQPAFAELAGVKKRTVIDWEHGVSSPTAVQLAALAAHGVDILYVVTGQRLPASLLSAVPSAPAPPRVALSADEAELLSDYRESPLVVRRSIKTLLREAASSSSSGTA